jgi:hypothetical protein
MKKQPDISSADEALFAIADLLKKEGSIDKLALFYAEALMANDRLQSAFNELYEKYQIREKFFAEELAKELAKQAMELQQTHDTHILQVRREHETNSKVYEAEINEALGPEAIDSKLKQITTELTIPLVGNAYLAGQNDGGKARAKVAAHKSHEDDYKNKRDAFQWFDKNFQLFPKAMDECASAAIKEIPVEFSTARNWLREWRKTQKRNI